MQTRTLFFSELLPNRHPNFWKLLQETLDTNGINYEWLYDTKDIWCRDYMPVLCPNNRMVQFQFSPSYLNDPQYRNIVTEPSLVLRYLKTEFYKSRLILDGGNILFHNGTAYCTERVFKENNKTEASTEISKQTGAFQVIIIPEQPDDFTGHMDGWVRFVGNKVLVNKLHPEMGGFWISAANRMIAQIIDSSEEMPDIIYMPHSQNKNIEQDTDEGNYLNFLELDEHVLIASYDRTEDQEVYEIFSELFPTKKILQIPCNEIALQGGGLHCISWEAPFLTEEQLWDIKSMHEIISPECPAGSWEIIPILYEHGLVKKNFDWMNWEEGKEHLEQKRSFADKDIDFCLKAITYMIRHEHFVDGALLEYCRTGVLQNAINTLYDAHQYIYTREIE